jgi:repressor LexA
MSLSGDFSTHQNRRIRPAVQNSDKNRLWKKLPFLEITKIWYDKIRFLNSGGEKLRGLRWDYDLQERIYQFIVYFVSENLYSPTIREICDGVGKNSTATISLYLEELEDIGRIILGHGPRTIKLVGFKVVEECEH